MVQLFVRLTSIATYLFPVWTVIASVVALRSPAAVSALTSPQLMQGFLSLLMLSTGLTLSPSDLVTAASKRRQIAFAFVACYFGMPVVALVLARAFSLEASVRTGLLLLSMVSGGQASNLCTQIAGGDTALSVAMTTVTTLCAAVMLPAVSAVLLGTAVPIDRVGLAVSTARLTLLPIAAGAATKALFPRAVVAVRPALPVVGIACVVVLVAGPVAQSATGFLAAWRMLVGPVVLLHIVGGLVGFCVARWLRWGWTTAVTTAFETAFKSPVLSYMLALNLFEPGVQLASSVSIVVLSPLAALCAVIVRARARARARKEA